MNDRQLTTKGTKYTKLGKPFLFVFFVFFVFFVYFVVVFLTTSIDLTAVSAHRTPIP
jgi:uncharacterized membrane protein